MRQSTTLILALALATSLTAAAEAKDGGITPAMIKTIQAQPAATAADRALSNAIAANGIDVLAKGKAQRFPVPAQFSVETPKQSIQNQKSSGRCWMFSGLNMLRGQFSKAHDGQQVVFSQTYTFFWDQLEKANLMLQGIIDTQKKPITDPQVQFLFKYPVSDGGTFCGVIDLVDKYGLVPQCVAPETFASESTAAGSKVIKAKLREYGLRLRHLAAEGKKAAALNQEKTLMLKDIYRMLALVYGEPVKEFQYTFRDKDGKPVGETKTYTPLSFAKACGATGLADRYIMLMNDPRNEYHKVFEIEYDRHSYDGHNWRYLNLPMEEIEAVAIAALKDGHKMYSSYDVGKMLDRKRGFASLDNYDYASLFQTSFPMTKAERLLSRESASSHAMTLTAVNLDADGKPTMWKVENSWGADSGQKGYLVMTPEWFGDYFFRLVADKKYATPEILRLMQQKPVMLPYDDALFVDE